MNVCFLGHGFGIQKGFEALQVSRDTLCGIVTHPRADHARDADVHTRLAARGLYVDVFEFATSRKIPLLESTDVNDATTLAWIQQCRPDAVVSIGSRHVIRPALLSLFPGKVLNIHTAPLPRYRGGANDSWMILHGVRQAHGVCHIVEEGLDAGPIVVRATYDIPTRALPIDVCAKRAAIIGELLSDALKKIQDPAFSAEPQDPAHVTYFPRLITAVDGQIRWAQQAEAIERHVRAFGVPYDGAFTVTRKQGKRLSVLDGHVLEHDDALHPNAIGLAYGLDGRGGVKVWTGRGTYVMTRVRAADGVESAAQPQVRLGTQFRSRIDEP